MKQDYKIVVRGLNKAFEIREKGKRQADHFQALSNLDLGIFPSEFVTIIGPSGCGKSTLLDIIAGLSHADAGEILIDGERITAPSLNRGIVMQGYALFPWRTVRKNVEYGLEVKGVKAAKRHEIADYFISLVNLSPFADRYPHELSGGMKQRVAIARALAYDPEVLLMDEPFGALDAQTREVLQEELLQIWEKTKKTILFVTHSIDEAVYLADRVLVLSPNPGTLREEIRVELPRPRRGVRFAKEFQELTQRISGSLHDASESSGSFF